MALIRNQQINSEMLFIKNRIKKDNIKISYIWFVMKRYLYYATKAMINGYHMDGNGELGFSLKSVILSDVPDKMKKMFRYSNKIFGYLFLPVCDTHQITDNGYNYKPCNSLIEAAADIADTDAIYEITER